jgi:hypothetical protein
MKSIIFVLLIVGIYLITTREEDVQETHTNPIETTEVAKKTYIDNPTNTYKSRVEAQNIANTLNLSNTYLGSRLDATGMAKDTVNVGNKRIEEQNKAMEALTK